MKEILFTEADYIKDDGSNGIVIVAEDGMLSLRRPEPNLSPEGNLRCDPVMKDTPENRAKMIEEAKQLVKELREIW